MLFGVVVLNGVVMVESINYWVGYGDSKDKVVFEGVVLWFRFVLMIVFILMFGFILMLLSIGIGVEI